MNVLAILRDAWFFYSRHFLTIVRLCLPLILLESLTRLGIDHWLANDAPPALDLLVGLIFYPLYVGALILFLDARSRGLDPALGAVYARALPLWPALAVLSGLGTLLILLGASLFVLPGIWVMVKIAFAEYLLVLRGLTPLAALKQSFQLTRGHFLLVLGCVMTVLLPVWMLEVWIAAQLFADETPPLLPAMLLDGVVGLLQLLPTIMLFRCFMLCSEPPARQSEPG
ncbi:YciC family protein [Stutzerimonas stutzeri]|uniref:YciC family protein n=1 Tax=Stutzerimonas stutzeri TaxID=316 RepID=UPI00244D4358|nr:YciC family protein [Stutzerimonas stutzeri]MDH0154214.1 YciC family protein [Stutzerimonas stutzeri]